MEKHLDITLDKKLSNISGLTWLPWIGKEYMNNKRRLLIVGESHYTIGKNEEEYQNRFKKATGDKKFTRKCIYESTICGDWINKTFDNIHRVLLRSNNFNKERFWEQVAFYNFIPRPMDYRVKERPTWVDFYSSWKTFVELIKILSPTDCVFIGVSAANSFNLAMEELRLSYTPVKWLEGIGTAYGRSAFINLNEDQVKLSFIQHASQMFSWSKWNHFLARENAETLTFLQNSICSKESMVSDEIPEQSQESDQPIGVPMHLAHKPIIACDYLAYTNANDDAKYLSIGHAQYDYEAASLKIFRHTGDKWSRQSEEIPINRVGDIALLLLAAMKKVYIPSPDHTSLNEVTLRQEELNFLKAEFESNKERLKSSFLEIKRLLNAFDIENI